jgi:16S rRNA C967 or C1407 C5-methylase (RsmB/RsmF family)/NOL1/NOP2/fmu family ribosome biogenesis protein
MSNQKFPAPFEQRMRNALNEQWENFAAAHERESPVSIRINPQKLISHSYADRIPWTSSGFYLGSRPSFTLDPIFHAGAYYVQEASSMFLEQAVLQATNYTSSLNVLDLCAAPGGKSTHLLSLLSRESLLVSNEVIRSRAPILAENLQKWGLPNAVVTSNDPKDFQRLGSLFDVIVVDAPCSGEGLFRKDPEAMTEWSSDNVLLCANRQRRIVKDIWPALKQNGILIYSTCTYSEQENEELLDWLEGSEDVEFIQLKLDPQWGVAEIKKKDIYGYRLFPHRVKGEGFFLSVLRKLAGEGSHYKPKKIFTPVDKKVKEKVSAWMKGSEETSFVMGKDGQVRALPMNKLTEVEWLDNHLQIISSGTAIATIKHDKLIPEHAAALSVNIDIDMQRVIDLTLQEALTYLRKDTLSVDSPGRGFALVRFNNILLGWVNVLENRINNLYPAQWRIRMQDRKE